MAVAPEGPCEQGAWSSVSCGPPRPRCVTDAGYDVQSLVVANEATGLIGGHGTTRRFRMPRLVCARETRRPGRATTCRALKMALGTDVSVARAANRGGKTFRPDLGGLGVAPCGSGPDMPRGGLGIRAQFDAAFANAGSEKVSRHGFFRT